jgi:hypothetical protein
MLSEDLEARHDRLVMRMHAIPHSHQVVFAVQQARMDKLVPILMSIWTGKAAKSEGHEGMRNGCGERETIEIAACEFTLHLPFLRPGWLKAATCVS